MKNPHKPLSIEEGRRKCFNDGAFQGGLILFACVCFMGGLAALGGVC